MKCLNQFGWCTHRPEQCGMDLNHIFQLITGTSHKHHGVSNRWQLNCLFNSFSRLTSKETSKLCITGPMWREPQVTGGFLYHQRASDAESSSMPWYHYVFSCYYAVPFFFYPNIACDHFICHALTQRQSTWQQLAVPQYNTNLPCTRYNMILLIT